MIDARDTHNESMHHDPEYRLEYESLEEEFARIDALVKASTRTRFGRGLQIVENGCG